MNFDLRERTILLTVAGSRAYGMNRPDSDVDMKGVAIPTAEYLHGFLNRFEQADKAQHITPFTDTLNDEEKRVVAETKIEGTVFGLVKFISLAVENNPNILDVLFCRDDEVRLLTPLGRKLREHRDMFLSARSKHSFSGYSAAQLKRIRGHRAWLLNPPTHQPTRAEFGLPENTLIPADQLAAARAAVQKHMDRWEFDFTGMADADVIRLQGQVAEFLTDVCANLGFPSVDEGKWLAAARSIGLDSNLIYVLQKEREYDNAHRQWKQYQDWKKNRNADRAKMEEESGFDRKHAAHLVRLLRMGREILTTGKCHVWRGASTEAGAPQDAEELLAIRNGAWSYDQVVEWAEREDAELETIYRSGTYAVPKQPDRGAIDRLCIELVEAALAADVSR